MAVEKAVGFIIPGLPISWVCVSSAEISHIFYEFVDVCQGWVEPCLVYSLGTEV